VIGLLSALFASIALLSDKPIISKRQERSVILEHALQVRRFLWVSGKDESFSLANIKLSGRYYVYRASDMCGACATASYILWKELCRVGFDAHFVFGEYQYDIEGHFPRFDWREHCWVTVGDLIVDVTASQFGKSRIYTPRINEDYREVALDLVALRHIRKGWSEDQVPYFDILRKYRQWLKTQGS
jgi:hypothetical protein